MENATVSNMINFKSIRHYGRRWVQPSFEIVHVSPFTLPAQWHFQVNPSLVLQSWMLCCCFYSSKMLALRIHITTNLYHQNIKMDLHDFDVTRNSFWRDKALVSSLNGLNKKHLPFCHMLNGIESEYERLKGQNECIQCNADETWINSTSNWHIRISK